MAPPLSLFTFGVYIFIEVMFVGFWKISGGERLFNFHMCEKVLCANFSGQTMAYRADTNRSQIPFLFFFFLGLAGDVGKSNIGMTEPQMKGTGVPL